MAAAPSASAGPASPAVAPPAPEVAGNGAGVVLFLGTSLTAGYGLDDPGDAYPALIQARLERAGFSYQVVNAGVSGDTSAGGLRRIDWLLDEPVAVLFLELGANDGLRGLDVDSMAANLDQVIRRTRARHPDARVVLAGMEAPPNLGARYTDAFRQAFRDVARAHDATLVPFLLEGVAGHPELNQPDGIHPNPEGHRRLADTAWQALEPVLAAGAATAVEGS